MAIFDFGNVGVVNCLLILSLAILPSSSCIRMERTFLISVVHFSGPRINTDMTQRAGLPALSALNSSDNCRECKVLLPRGREGGGEAGLL
jgi:hypothetical protein